MPCRRGCASLPLIGVQLGGRVMDQQMGLGLAGVRNPEFDENTGIVSEFYFVLATAMFVILGGHLILFDILVGSFQHFPLGGFRIDTMVVGLLTALLTMIYEMAVRVAAPMLCLIFLETLAMGFIARTVPQMNILSVGFAIRILLGAVLLVMAIGIHGDVLLEVMQSVFAQLREIFGEGRAIGQ